MSGRGSRARHVHVMSLNLLTSRTSPLRALYLYQTANESALEKTEPLSLRDFDFQSVTQEYIGTARHFVRSVFLQRSTLKLWNWHRIPTDAYLEEKRSSGAWISEWLNLKNNSPCRSADALVTLIFPKGWAYTASLSLSLSLSTLANRLDPDRTRI